MNRGREGGRQGWIGRWMDPLMKRRRDGSVDGWIYGWREGGISKKDGWRGGGGDVRMKTRLYLSTKNRDTFSQFSLVILRGGGVL